MHDRNAMRRLLLVLITTTIAIGLPAAPGEETGSVRLTHAGVFYSPFLPVITTGIQLRASLDERVAWGVALEGFYALGRSIHVELFLEPVYVETSRWRLSSRVGVLAGLHEEFPVGPPPEAFVGPGLHIVPLELMGTARRWYASLSAGLKVASDFTRVAGSLYAGLGAGVRLHGR